MPNEEEGGHVVTTFPEKEGAAPQENRPEVSTLTEKGRNGHNLDSVNGGGSLSINKEMTFDFLSSTVRECIHLFAADPNGCKDDPSARAGKYFGADALAATRWAAEMNARGWNVWWTVNKVRPDFRGKKPGKDDIIAAPYVHLDLDPPKDGSSWDKDAEVTKLMAMAMPPSFIADTGNGLGAFWRLDEETSNLLLVEGVNTAIRDMFHADSCQNIDRVMGLPGTINYPNDPKRGRGAKPVMRGWVKSDDGEFVNLTHLAGAYPPPPVKPSHRRTAEIQGDIPLQTADSFGLEALSEERSVIEHPVGVDRSQDMLRCAGVLRRAGFSDEQIAGVLLNPENAVSAHAFSQPDPRRAVMRCIAALGRADKRRAALWGTALDGNGLKLSDFWAVLPQHAFAYVAGDGGLWPQASIDGALPLQLALDSKGEVILDEKGKPVKIKPSKWLDQNRACVAMTWAPGEDVIIDGKTLIDGAWVSRPGTSTYNLYRAPPPCEGDSGQAGPWIDHVRRLYPDEAEHLFDWLAHRVQRPGEKVNHALVLGGGQGIGKDTILEPVKTAVGHWNFSDVGPGHVLGRFNGYVKSVILRVSEARDLGEHDRFQFYDKMKTLIAAPPDVLRIDEKNRQEYTVPNVCGVVITTNHKTDGIHLEPDDRRHFVCWADAEAGDFGEDYFNRLYRWLARGGTGHVAAFLRARDLTDFNPKAPPLKTAAFWAIVDAGRNPDDAEMASALDRAGWPDVITVDGVVQHAAREFAEYLKERRNARKVPHRFETAGYVPVRNADARDGAWAVNGKRVSIYARKTLSQREAIVAIRSLL